MGDEMYDGMIYDYVNIEWGGWKKKIAIIPVKLDDGKLHLGSYYTRSGSTIFFNYVQRVKTVIDILRVT